MTSYILSVATAVPPFVISQQEAMEKMFRLFSFNEEEKKTVRNLYRNSGINKRHLIIPDFTHPDGGGNFFGKDYPAAIPGMRKRNDLYKTKALELAHQAAKKTLCSWDGDPSAITHVISVSCTGVVAPGIEFSLVQLLSLSRTVCRLGINFMGCFGAFKGLEMAAAIARSNPKARILVVCTELCSLHLQHDINSDNLIANSIFADGAAAVVVGGNIQPKENPLWKIIKNSSLALENTYDQMAWEAGDHGFFMKLSQFVPLNIAKYIQNFSKSLLESYTTSSDCHWAIHPGGKAILKVIEKKLALKKWQTKNSWEVLENYGNMSSATFLFVLDRLKEEKSGNGWCAGIGFGPGLSVEGLLLKKA